MDSSATIGWLKEEFSSRFQQKESEYLTTLVWFDQNRYSLPAEYYRKAEEFAKGSHGFDQELIDWYSSKATELESND